MQALSGHSCRPSHSRSIKRNERKENKTTYHGDECRAGHVGHLFRGWRLSIGQVGVHSEAIGCGTGVCAGSVRRGSTAAGRNGTNIRHNRGGQSQKTKKEFERRSLPTSGKCRPLPFWPLECYSCISWRRLEEASICPRAQSETACCTLHCSSTAAS